MINFIRFFAAASIALMLDGCATVQPVASVPEAIESRHLFDKNYVLGQQRSAFVGDSMIRVKDYWELRQSAETLNATKAFTLGLPPFMSASMPEGAPVQVLGTTTRDGKTYRVIRLPDPNAVFLKFLIDDDGMMEGSAINNMGERMGRSYAPVPPDVRFVAKTITRTDMTRGMKNFELVYGGTDGKSISIRYREYTPDDLARPAFTQDLTYASTSTTVRFRELQIDIASADNEKITFTVVRDGT